jgi:molybdopterin-containing oxidoreductase family membrane subunit
MWASSVLVLLAAIMLIQPRIRANHGALTFACIAVIAGIWIDKGLGMVVTGFVPSPLGHVTKYVPTLPEILICLAIYAFGALVITLFYKIALSVRGELKA